MIVPVNILGHTGAAFWWFLAILAAFYLVGMAWAPPTVVEGSPKLPAFGWTRVNLGFSSVWETYLFALALRATAGEAWVRDFLGRVLRFAADWLFLISGKDKLLSFGRFFSTDVYSWAFLRFCWLLRTPPMLLYRLAPAPLLAPEYASTWDWGRFLAPRPKLSLLASGYRLLLTAEMLPPDFFFGWMSL